MDAEGKRAYLAWALLGGVTVLAAGAVIGLGLRLQADALSIPVVTGFVLGILVLLVVALGALALLYQSRGLDGHGHALALPPGSVRAVLALGLMIIFVGVSLSLFLALSAPAGRTVATIERVAAADVEELEQRFGDGLVVVTSERAAGDGLVDVHVLRAREGPGETTEEIAKQVLTTVATALVTIIGFYFGSRVAAGAAGTQAGGAGAGGR